MPLPGRPERNCRTQVLSSENSNGGCIWRANPADSEPRISTARRSPPEHRCQRLVGNSPVARRGSWRQSQGGSVAGRGMATGDGTAHRMRRGGTLPNGNGSNGFTTPAQQTASGAHTQSALWNGMGRSGSINPNQLLPRKKTGSTEAYTNQT